METALISNEQSLSGVPARNVYPDLDGSRQLFMQHVDSGDISLECLPHDNKSQDVTVIVPVWNSEFYPLLDQAKLPEGNLSLEEVLGAAPNEISEAIRQEDVKLVAERAFDVTMAISRAWWIPATEKDHNSQWLDDATLEHVAVLGVGDKNIIVNDFAGDIDETAFYEGLKAIATRMASEGLNIAEFFKAINVVGEDNPRFVVPEHIRKENPDAYVRAFVGAKGAYYINSRTIREGFRKDSKDGFIVGSGWGDNVYHELAHLLNMGLASRRDEHTAKEMGWRKRDEVITDDYGQLIDKAPGDFIGYSVVDDYGREVFVGSMSSPELLTTPEGVPLSEEFGPPSRYAHESSHEDIAESFAAHALGKHLDAVRTRAVRNILDQHSTPGEAPEVSLRIADPANFDPFDYMSKTVKYLQYYTNYKIHAPKA